MRPPIRIAVTFWILSLAATPVGEASVGQSPPLSDGGAKQIAAPASSTIDAFVCSGTPEHGIRYTDANALGPGALPRLVQILADQEKKDCWANTVCVISAINAEQSYETLRGFVWDRFSGEVDEPTFRALESAVVTIGFTSPSQPKLAMDFLEQGADPQHWKALPWHYPGQNSSVLQERFSRMCIMGLGYCSDPRSQSILLRMLDKPYGQRHHSSIQSALRTQRAVAAQGLYEYERAAARR